MKPNVIVVCAASVLAFTLLGGCSTRDMPQEGGQAPVMPKVQMQGAFPVPQAPSSPSSMYPKTEARPKQLGRIHEQDGKQARQQQAQQKQDEHNRPMQKRVGQHPAKQLADIPKQQPIAARSLQKTPKPPDVPDEVRGIYVSGWVAGGTKAMGKLTRLVEQTDLNAMVIDVKNDFGELTYDSKLPVVDELGADANPTIKDMPALLKRLKAKGIYTIGRVVAFKDPLLAKSKTEWAIHTKNGGLWQDRKGVPWVDPYHPDVRAYNIAIAEEAARLGFQEIQFDYVRFPDNAEEMDKVVRYHHPAGRAKEEVIGSFLRDARPVLHQAGAALSADVFGLVTSSRDDMGIGQTWRQVAPFVDVVSPMTYPSHYSSGMYGIRYPDLEPDKVIRRAMEDAVRRNGILAEEGKKPGVVRPWLQAFTATWVHPHQSYQSDEIDRQVRAAKQAGVRQFLLWSSNCKYSYHS